MDDYVGLEISLAHLSEDRYRAELRYTRPDSNTDRAPVSGQIRLSPADLSQHSLDPRAYGGALSAALFGEQALHDELRQALAAAQAMDRKLRLRLFVQRDAADLHRLLWETLGDPGDESWLLLNNRVLFSRMIAGAGLDDIRLRPRSGLRALVVVADPQSLAERDWEVGDGGAKRRLAPIEVDEELERAEKALLGVDITPLKSDHDAPVRVTLAAIEERLRAVPYDILYLVRRLGNIDATLGGYYAEELGKIAGEEGVAERFLRDWVEGELITVQGLRGQVLKGAAKTAGLANDVLDALVDARLLRSERRRGADWYELAHDRLIEPVLQSNRGWREANLNALQRQALSWAAGGRDEAQLFGGRELIEAERWAEANDAALTDDERDFLAASRRLQERRSRTTEQGTNLEELGWGVIFAEAAGPSPPEREALRELLDHRRAQAAELNPAYYHEFVSPYGYRQGESAQKFLERNGAGSLRAAPDKVPLYLLIVGDPETIPFEFQHGLDVLYAVGRLHFDTLTEYASYARSVVTAERGDFALPRQAAIFAPTHKDVRFSESLERYLIRPTVSALSAQLEWSIQAVLGLEARRDRLIGLLGGPETPALLFTGSSYKPNPQAADPQSAADLGAIIGAEHQGLGQVAREHYVTAEDVPDTARLLGMITFLFGSSTAGIPQSDKYSDKYNALQVLQDPDSLFKLASSSQPKLALLPQRLLGHPAGGALAVIGHIGSTWIFPDNQKINEFAIFETVLRRLMDGYTVGMAIDLFHQRYAALSAQLGEELSQVMFRGKTRDDRALQSLMNRATDARNYVVVGDPAARLPLGPNVTAERPTIEPVGQIEIVQQARGVEVNVAGIELAPTEINAAGDAPDDPVLAPPVEPPGPPPLAEPALLPSGVNGATGGYLLPPLPIERLLELILEGTSSDDGGTLKNLFQQRRQSDIF